MGLALSGEGTRNMWCTLHLLSSALAHHTLPLAAKHSSVLDGSFAHTFLFMLQPAGSFAGKRGESGAASNRLFHGITLSWHYC